MSDFLLYRLSPDEVARGLVSGNPEHLAFVLCEIGQRASEEVVEYLTGPLPEFSPDDPSRAAEFFRNIADEMALGPSLGPRLPADVETLVEMARIFSDDGAPHAAAQRLEAAAALQRENAHRRNAQLDAALERQAQGDQE